VLTKLRLDMGTLDQQTGHSDQAFAKTTINVLDLKGLGRSHDLKMSGLNATLRFLSSLWNLRDREMQILRFPIDSLLRADHQKMDTT